VIILINNHVLLPHRANWTAPPQTSRLWETGITPGITGAEQRQALRAWGRRSLGYTVTCRSLEQRARLDAQLDSGKNSGMACAPYFGRATALAAGVAAGAGAITLANPFGWTWASGDYVALLTLGDDTIYDVHQVLSVTGAGATLNLADNLTHNWLFGENVWPLLFGVLSTDKIDVLSSWHEAVPITLTQRAAERAAQLGATPAGAGPGVGQQVIGSTNLIA
jgi:hypothetical protein